MKIIFEGMHNVDFLTSLVVLVKVQKYNILNPHPGIVMFPSSEFNLVFAESSNFVPPPPQIRRFSQSCFCAVEHADVHADVMLQILHIS